MKTCVEIELDTDSGQITVGPCEPSEEKAGEGETGMQPAKDIDSALQMAKDMLTNPQAQAGQQGADQGAGPAAAPGGGQMMGRMSPADMAWNKVKADRQAMA